ncbi:hypothetical protein RG113_001125 [Acinetobacter baumannii]|uniref:Uncharacterized protein n=4 Tax=Acinetobacter calcoaceticus/baumannii complex TaxID=909768 RepID=A0AA36KD02_ACINO|nr:MULTISPECIES: hypothetical protein [Acinetobacter calcoaceticus/baumannii complex]AGQ09476.1 hypothetical protein BJAB0868_00926 [Acinetobacter baumannii BJAB0868]AIL77359.1 hypothetical protein IX87_01535 [Acinetobacter baumannii]ALJ88954.1 hypothetical protein AN415_03054 [Acinetobacter baumannii]ALY00528.1 hypothetical protein KBNAB1_3008 [Acinetobacter baumannii]AMC14504.1 hypothetical protein AXA63_03060 [Acinetobacter baumannii]
MNTNFLRGSRRYNNSPNGTTNNKSFREFKGKDEERGLYKVRLGHTVYAANHTLTRVYTIDEAGELTPVTQYTLDTNEWILRNLQTEIKYRRGHELNQILSKTHIPSPDRKDYKKRRGFLGTR